ncbi:MAG TPA: M23 family metallopeptidase [Myxococcaceae bacterium]|nr:M23 family metallopeptidase [Myxococcaceae bacterium]
MAALCLWAAAYHTPAGAFARSGYAWATNQRSSAPSLLAYYAGGEPEVAQSWADAPAPPSFPEGGASGRLALGHGAYAALMKLEPPARVEALAVAKKHGVDPALLEDAASGPREAARLLEALSPEFASDEAAVVALLCGEEPARYAVARARAEGRAAELAVLARALPPRFEPHLRQVGHALTLGTAYGLSWPVDRGAISSPFGPRRNPVTGASQLHTGVDIPMPEGTAVRAAASGIVRRASEDALNGKVLIVDHGHGVTTAYCHNSALEVTAGARVERGERLSLSGNTGRSTGPHLHYQLELSGKPVDPLRFRPEPSSVSRGAAP